MRLITRLYGIMVPLKCNFTHTRETCDSLWVMEYLQVYTCVTWGAAQTYVLLKWIHECYMRYLCVHHKCSYDIPLAMHLKTQFLICLTFFFSLFFHICQYIVMCCKHCMLKLLCYFNTKMHHIWYYLSVFLCDVLPNMCDQCYAKTTQ